MDKWNPTPFFNQNPEVQDLTINYTTWINTTVLEESTSPTTSSTGTGPLPTKRIDGLWFLGHASNSTCFTSYEHDDNYQVYFPGQWDLPYALDGIVDRHVHLWSSLLSSWIAGNLTHAFAVLAGLLTGKFLENLLSASEEDLIAAVAEFLDAPWLIALWVAYDVYDIINQIAQMLGYATTAVWVYNTIVEKYSGDGWMWASPEVVRGFWRYAEPYYFKPFLWERYYEVRAWNETWGTDGVELSSPNKHEISVAWETEDIVITPPAGVWYCERGNAQPR